MTSKRNLCKLQTAEAISASPAGRQQRSFRRTVQSGAAADNVDVDDDDNDDVSGDEETELDDDVFDKCETWLRDVAAANQQQQPDLRCS